MFVLQPMLIISQILANCVKVHYTYLHEIKCSLNNLLSFTKFKNHILYICGFEFWLYALPFFHQGENENLLIHDIDDVNTMYVLVSKGAHATHLNMNSQKHHGVQPIQKLDLGYKLILGRIAFDLLIEYGRM